MRCLMGKTFFRLLACVLEEHGMELTDVNFQGKGYAVTITKGDFSEVTIPVKGTDSINTIISKVK